MILARRLDVDHEDLLEPERELRQDVPLLGHPQLSFRPIVPDCLEITPVVGILPEILEKPNQISLLTSCIAHSGWHTHHAKTPDAQIVHKQPRLFRESNRGFLFQPCLPRQWPEDPINEHRPDRRESQNRAEDIVRVIPAGAVQTRFGLIVR